MMYIREQVHFNISILFFRTFGVVNPTNKAYNFEWICEDRNDDATKISPFKCVTTEGLIKNGKRFPVSLQQTFDCFLCLVCYRHYDMTKLTASFNFLLMYNIVVLID